MATSTQLYPQDVVHSKSLSDPTGFWGPEARKLIWAKPPSCVLEESPVKDGRKHWKWFPNGEISTTYNCLTRHINAGYGEQTAIIWDSPVTDTYSHRTSYAQLLKDVQVLAGVLRGMGVEKGSRVLVYSRSLFLGFNRLLINHTVPMIPPALTTIYAISHLGAVHSVVFGGFSPAECAKRIASAQPEVIVTASCGIEGGIGKRRVTPYLPLVREAVQLSRLKGKGCKLLVWQRPQHVEELQNGERDCKEMMDAVQRRWSSSGGNEKENTVLKYQQDGKEILGIKKHHPTPPEDEWAPVIDGVPVGSNDPLYTIYTSGMVSHTRIPQGD